jgi:hypothetical protein
MAWQDQLDLEGIKSILNICDDSFDYQLQDWVDLIGHELTSCGVQLDFTDDPVTEIIKPRGRNKHLIVGCGDFKVYSIGAWQSITVVEESCDNGSTWKSLTLDEDYTERELNCSPFPIIELERLECGSCSGYWDCKTQLRITGMRGIAPSTSLPAWIRTLYYDSISLKYEALSNKSPNGTYITKEKTQTKEISYGLLPNSCQICEFDDVMKQGKFRDILKKYCVYKQYGF